MTEQEIEAQALIGHDLNRITPRAFLRIDSARKALLKEVLGLTRPNNRGMSALQIINGMDRKYRGLTRNHSMVAMRQKPTTFKARLVSRGI